MDVKEMRVADIIPYENNPRKNEGAVDAVAASIKEFGFKNPIIVDSENVVVAGHTRLKAAEKLGLESVPVVIADDLTEEQVKAYRLADNKTAELAGWDFEALDIELFDIDKIDMEQFGFEFENEDENEPSDITEVEFKDKISVVIDCENDQEAEMIFEKLTNEGYVCRISTL